MDDDTDENEQSILTLPWLQDDVTITTLLRQWMTLKTIVHLLLRVYSRMIYIHLF